MPVTATTILLCLLMLFQRTTTRPLRELGRIDLPNRLEPRDVREHPRDSVFTFDHIENSIFLMGSSTPVSEKLVLVFSDSAPGPADVDLAKNAADRTHITTWRTEGPDLIGEGIHEVNNSKHPAWVIVRKDEARHLTAGYMRWQKQASLADGKTALTRAIATLHLDRAVPDYLRIARDRPAHLARQHLDRIHQVLATKGVRLTIDGPPQYSDGILYSLVNDTRLGPRFDALAILGDRPAGRYRVLTVPNVHALQWSNNGWAPTDSSYLPPYLLKEALRSRLVDHARVHFGAVSTAFPSDPDIGGQLDLESFWHSLPDLKRRFEQGKLVEPAR